MGATASKTPPRAAQLYLFEARQSDSPCVDKLWRTRSAPADAFISVAVTHWEMIVTRRNGKTTLTVRGPETIATTVPIVSQHAEYFGIEFRAGAFMPALPVSQLVDGAMELPEAAGKRFWLHGSAWEFPDFDNADVFIRRLVRQGLLVRDPVVEAALRGESVDLSPRSVQRRVVRATGLTRSAIRQIERAEQAVGLLDRGVPILDAVAQTGYADQAHMTRALRRFAGQTPGQIAHAAMPDSQEAPPALTAA